MITPSNDRWFGVGASNDADPVAAAIEATDAALVGDDPKLTVVFASSRYDLDALVGTIAERTPGVPMIGCTTAGEISTRRASDHSVAITALGGGFDIVTAVAGDAAADLTGAGARAAAAVAELPPTEHQVLLLLTDGLAGNQQDVVRGAYAEVGATVPLVGGCAGDDTAMVKTHQIHDGAVLENSVVSAAIGSDAPLGIGVRHGWRAIGEPMLVTRSDGTTVYELDQAPALDVYLDRLGAASLIADHPDDFTDFAMTHPLGLNRRAGEEVRFINGADMTTRSLTSIAEVPQGALVWIMEGDSDSVLAGTTASCTEALSTLDGEDPIGLLVFDCIARRNVLGPAGVDSEMSTIADLVPTVPVAGFYTYGEIARTHGVRGFHNQTMVTLAFS